MRKILSVLLCGCLLLTVCLGGIAEDAAQGGVAEAIEAVSDVEAPVADTAGGGANNAGSGATGGGDNASSDSNAPSSDDGGAADAVSGAADGGDNAASDSNTPSSDDGGAADAVSGAADGGDNATSDSNAPSSDDGGTSDANTDAPDAEGDAANGDALPDDEASNADSQPIVTDEPAPPADYGSGPAYIWDGEARHYGTLDELLPLANGGTIFIHSPALIELEGYGVSSLRNYSFCPDYDVFEDDMLVIVSTLNPSGNTKAGVVFIWVGRQEDVPKPAQKLEEIITAGEDDILEREIQVTAADYSQTAPCRPSFRLTAIPEADSGMVFAVMLDGGQPVPISGDSYAPDAGGSYRFALLDTDGAVLARSAAFNVTYAEDEPDSADGNDNADGDNANGTNSTDADAVSADNSNSDGGSDAVNTDNNDSANDADADSADINGSPDTDEAPNDDADAITTDTNAILTPADEANPDGTEGDLLAAPADSVPALPILTVTTDEAYVDDAWSPAPQTFTLSSVPDIAGDGVTPTGYAYAVSVDGEPPVRLGAPSYTADANGSRTLRFLILDDAGTTVSESDIYKVKIDMTLPLIMASSPQSLTLEITAGDLVSAIVGVSADGGKSWLAPTDLGEGVYTLKLRAASAVTFAAGSIMAIDEAGNKAANTKPVSLAASDRTPPESAAGAGGAAGASRPSGSDSSSYRSVSHVSASTTGVTAYNGVELVVEDGLMNRLMIGDESLDLDLLPCKNDAVEGDEEHIPGFVAEFLSLEGGGEGVDTLALTCADELDTDGGYSYTWEFTGAVYKKLAASGVDYMLLRVGERVAVLSTAGFSAGVRYNMYRAEGRASKEFRYAVTMGAPEPSLSMTVTIDDETYQMTDDSSTEFYYYDVKVGTADEFLVTDEG